MAATVPVTATTVTESYTWDGNVAIPIPIPADLQSHASSVALSDPAVLALTGSRRISVVQVSAYGGTLWAQVYVKLDDGEATLTGDWPHVVFDNNTDRRQGPLRYHFEPGTGTRTVKGLLVNVDTDTWTVKEILSDPPIDQAPPHATTKT